MRKLMVSLIVCMLCTLSGCQKDSPQIQDVSIDKDNLAEQRLVSKDGPVELTEKLFLSQINDICLNQEDYLGRTIKYEGLFTQYHWKETDMDYYLVYRKSPGCCGADGQAGFEVVWPEGSDKPYPKENDWCEVVGTLETCNEGGGDYLRIVLDSLTVLNVRGAEFVSQ